MADDYYGTTLPTVENYISRAFHATAVLGNWLYIDGGEIQFNRSNDTIQEEVLNSTLAVDLSSSWTNETVTFRQIPRGAAPLLNDASLWSDAQSSGMYLFGGVLSGWLLEDSVTPTPPSLWKFIADDAGGGSWTQQPTPPTPGAYFPSNQPRYGVRASNPGLGFYLGGQLDSATYPQEASDVPPVPLSGMIQFNSTANQWQNITTPFPGGPSASMGGGHFVPTFGPQGMLVVFGTVPPSTCSDTCESADQSPFTTISVFEPTKQAWYSQTASAPSGQNVPQWRSWFCIAGASGDNGTYEIFIHGGTTYSSPGSLLDDSSAGAENYELQLDAVYILSLPSFTWYQAPYTPIQSRSRHSCEVAGNRQLLVVGGDNYLNIVDSAHAGDQDAFAQGLGVFDMTNLKWMPSYNASAADYQTPQVIKSYVQSAGPTPSSWDNPALAELFATSRPVPTASPSALASPSTSSASHSATSAGTSAGAIAGGVVGGLAGLALIALIAYFVLRRRRKYSKAISGPGSDGLGKERHEVGGKALCELHTREKAGELRTTDAALAWEMDAMQQPARMD